MGIRLDYRGPFPSELYVYNHLFETMNSQLSRKTSRCVMRKCVQIAPGANLVVK